MSAFPYKLLFLVENKGKTLGSTKKKIEWHFAFAGDDNDEEEHYIQLKISRLSGKKVLRYTVISIPVFVLLTNCFLFTRH
jgi:hypothetical protein